MFNRAGLHQALTMAGFTVEVDDAGADATAPTPPSRDDEPVSRTRLKHRIGLLGRSVAVRAHPVDLG